MRVLHPRYPIYIVPRADHRFMLGAIEASGYEVMTVSLRRDSSVHKSGQAFWNLIESANVRVLPNTAGCRYIKEAVITAHMARERFKAPWIKLEVIGDDVTLQPDLFGLVDAARILADDGFEVFPYITDDLIVADRLLNAGCQAIYLGQEDLQSASMDIIKSSGIRFRFSTHDRTELSIAVSHSPDYIALGPIYVTLL